jgi:membrane protease YdiL (CAAX protease family)
LSDSQNNPPPSHGPLDESVARDFTLSSSDPAAPAPPPAAPSEPAVAQPPQVSQTHIAPGFHVAPARLAAEERYARLAPDLRVPWTWLDVFLLVVFSIATIFVMSVVFAGIYAALGHDPRAINPNSPSMIYVAVILQVFLDAGILIFLLAQMRLRYQLPAWTTLGWHPLPKSQMSSGAAVLSLIAGGILLSFVVAAASQLFPPKKQLPVEQIMQDHRTAIFFMLMAVLVAPVVEETLFRGYLYPVAARSFGVPAGIVITGTLFGLLHASQLSGGTWLIVLMVVVGSVLTWIRARSGTVLASFIVHTAYNGVQVVGLLIATHGLTKAIPHS